MRTRTRNPFTTVSTAGLLLPVDLLTRIIDGDPNLPGLTAQDYHLRSNERLNEAASRAWNECLTAWKSFRKRFAALPASDAGTTLTRDEWLLPLFQELGYGRLQPKRAVQIESREYPISHGWESHVPIHLLSARYPIDRRTQGVAGAATRAPYSLLQEFLNRSSQHRWGFVSNGLKLYLLHDNAALARAANVEFDLEAMLDGELYADFMLLFLLCHQSRVEIQSTPIAKVALDRKTGKAKKAKATQQKKLATDDDPEDADGDEQADVEEQIARLGPENCWLERWANQADQQGTRAREKLRDGVETAIKSLGAGFLTTKGNNALRERLRTGELSTQDYYRQLLRVIYRLLMLLVAEEKKTENGQNLLHPPSASPEVRDRYARFYSVSRIRILADERRGTAHTDLYVSLKLLFLKLRDGYAPLGIPGMGSFLFSDDSTPDLDQALLSNQDLLDAFRNLCYTEDTSGRGGSVRRPVDFGNLGSDELGSVYESLLELHPKIGTDDTFTLDTAAGNERKTTGSYYTPTSLINCLLDSALDPVVHAAIDVPDPAEAEQELLDLKVCDPACGSGHFLIAAAERMAMHLARLRTGDDQPNTLDVQHAKRDIIGRCIYGVDVNPMAVELCKVSLWMEALEPGKPLSFLDHHIQCGNSLLGTTPRLLAEGIPDDAFTPIEGDDRKLVAELKKDNKQQRKDYEKGQGYLFAPLIKLGNLPAVISQLNLSGDESLADIQAKQELYEKAVKGTDYLNARLFADTWCAAFVWQKDQSDLGKLCPTERDFRKIENSPHNILPHVKSEVRRLADQYKFFHWHLAFPDVFRLPTEGEAENEQAGWDAGFDLVLGNPPWERIKIQEKEWFAERSPSVASAKNAADRKNKIAAIKDQDPILYHGFLDATRHADATSAFMRLSARFPLCGVGDINTYPVFAETASAIVGRRGAFGMILPQGIITDDSTKAYFQELVRTRTLKSALNFINERMIFPAVMHNFRFCLLTVGGADITSPSPLFVFNCFNIDEASDPNRSFTLTAEQIRRLNPLTQTCPTFFFRQSAELSITIYETLPILGSNGTYSGWNVELLSMLHMGNASKHFSTEPGPNLLPVYESKMIHQYSHRFASYGALSKGERSHMLPATPVVTLQEPSFSVEPCYFCPSSEVSSRLEGKCNKNWLIASRRISNPALARTCIYSVIPVAGASDSITLLSTAKIDSRDASYIVGNMNSFVQDYCLRQKQGGVNVSFYIKHQLPIVPRGQYLQSASFASKRSLGDWVVPRVLELTYTAWDLEAFATDCAYDAPPFRWDEERRFQIRCELDAAYFHLYLGSKEEWGTDNPTLREMFPSPRDAVDYIMDTFPIVRRKDEAKYNGDYRTKRTILEIYDQMAEAIRTGQPYQTQLDPPPGPPTDADGNFIPFAQWTADLNTSHIHAPRDAEISKPRPIVVDPAFPQTDLEKVQCACLLEFVTSQPRLTEEQYVDLMILAMQTANCRLLLTGGDRDRFDQSLKAVLPELIVDTDGKPPWHLLLATLRANRSIEGNEFTVGANAQIVRGKLPDIDNQFMASVLKAGERLRELQEAATPDPAYGELVNSVRSHRAAAMTGVT